MRRRWMIYEVLLFPLEEKSLIKVVSSDNGGGEAMWMKIVIKLCSWILRVSMKN